MQSRASVALAIYLQPCVHVHVHVPIYQQHCMRLQATCNSACDAFKTSVKAPQLFNFLSPGYAATDNDSGPKHAWQALVLLFLGVAAAVLNREVGAKGALVFLPQAAVLLPLTLLLSYLQAHLYPPRDRWYPACLCNDLKQGLSLANIQALCCMLYAAAAVR